LSEIDIHHKWYQTPQLIEVEKDICVKTHTSILFNESDHELSLLCSDCHVLEHTHECSDYNILHKHRKTGKVPEMKRPHRSGASPNALLNENSK
jgi:hypothetical protein